MAVRGEDIAAIIRQQIEQYGATSTMVDVGTVIEVGDGIARIHGLSGASYGELLEFPNDVTGMALNLEEETVGAVIFGNDTLIKEGDEVRSTGRVAEVPVGEALIGRIVGALGQPLDGKGVHPQTPEHLGIGEGLPGHAAQLLPKPLLPGKCESLLGMVVGRRRNQIAKRLQ